MQQIHGESDKRQSGGYLATRIRATDKLSLIAGARYSRYRAGSYNTRSQSIEHVSGGRLTPYTGIVYDFHPNFSAYASYSSLFVPQTQKDRDGGYLKPLTGSHLEAGIKASWLQGRLNASAALYRARKNHLAVAAGRDANGDTYYQAADQAAHHGWEAEISGRLTESWQLQAGYSQSRTRDRQGKRLNSDNIPERSFKLYLLHHAA